MYTTSLRTTFGRFPGMYFSVSQAPYTYHLSVYKNNFLLVPITGCLNRQVTVIICSIASYLNYHVQH